MFHCTHCDAQYPKWSGKCLECDHWGTIKEESDAPSSSPAARASGGSKAKAKETTSLKDVKAQDEHVRLSIGEHELDRVLGGGIVTGSLTLLSGEPGIGKSTLVAGMAAKIASTNHDILYISGEESATQLKSRFDRLNSDLSRIKFLEMVSVEELVATLEKEKPTLAIVDSVQTMFSSAVDAQSGSPTLVRYATSCLLELAKRTGISLLLVGQVTKDGSVAGPKTLEHLVDTVLSLTGEPSHELRILEATKNRFGATDEIGVFEMTSEGLKTVENPSARFLAERVSVPGSVIATVREGSRIFLVEVQALVEKSFYGTPVRRANGMDQNRLQMLIAILSKRAGLHLGESDVYVNVVGGMQLKEPASDLAVCAAIMSAAKNRMDSEPIVYIGEVGLGGEVRNVMALEKRVNEAKRVGIEKAVTPKTMKSVKEL
ncbi:DNA repair protein RadA [Candidatus Uhrbacteria bacterium RIFCSPLOWO2_02_FULL_48_18]|uniref:DNA repair protein RadA n=1 Tax=Candidatus Uhrbacteria bacterium RIFCSPLOWO2_02_FULL_48_18 TaxID=1802408 RepID=A0A1F7V6P7_9BACT|nr:MAG: DNA repair protein RadA [Candidatus Uhrbacteria bacterium RIFCSPLOWO2_01_FULL_47_17]OGL86179.1 MAG: DNA repair protein RadA [Candidatus Uhrbacteria bacterium RIFCSPLOWO2_02_FULL_48_18]